MRLQSQSDRCKLGRTDGVRLRILFALYCPRDTQAKLARSAVQKLGNSVKLEFVDAPCQEPSNLEVPIEDFS